MTSRNVRSPIIRRRLRKGTEGMTLIEIMIVVVIMALIATAVGVAVIPRLEAARIDSTRTDAQSIRSAVQMYKVENHDCPSSVEDLAGDYLDSSRRMVDAWDNDFQIECEGNDIFVVSAGPDGQFGTEDDVE